MKIVQFNELTFCNDFAFCSILSEDESLCRKITELITGRTVKEIVRKEGQKSIRESANGKGVRFDVYFEDEEAIYDIEMQTTNQGNLSKRTRYYHSLSDLEALRKGVDYKQLKNSYVIFICTFDPFGQGKYQYHAKRIILEDEAIHFEDGAETIFISSDNIWEEIPTKMKSFLIYLKYGETTDPLTEEIDAALQKLLNSDERRLEYMTLLERDEMMRNEGRIEGRNEGRIEGISEIILFMHRSGKTPEEIAKSTGVAYETVLDCVRENQS